MHAICTTPTSSGESILLGTGCVASTGDWPLTVLLPRPSCPSVHSPKTKISSGAVGASLIFWPFLGDNFLGMAAFLLNVEGELLREGFALLGGLSGLAPSCSSVSGLLAPAPVWLSLVVSWLDLLRLLLDFFNAAEPSMFYRIGALAFCCLDTPMFGLFGAYVFLPGACS